MHQNTSFGARKCLLGARIVKKILPLTLGGKREIQAKNPNARCQIVKSNKKGSKWRLFGIISHDIYVFRHGESEFEVILKPEVELMVFLRRRSNKNMKNAGKCA